MSVVCSVLCVVRCVVFVVHLVFVDCRVLVKVYCVLLGVCCLLSVV